MSRFEKLFILLLVVYISVFVANLLMLRSHGEAVRELKGAISETSDRPMKIEIKQIR